MVKQAAHVIADESGIRTVRGNETFASYEIVVKDGLEYALRQTALLDRAQARPKDRERSEDLLERWRAMLRGSKRFAGWSEEDLAHVVFGILLGYPDAAIICDNDVNDPANQKDDPFREPLINADIRGAGYYICPQPVYSYPRRLVNDAGIKAHEKLWSGLLKAYYTSPFHTRLAANADFAKKMNELGGVSAIS